jgi:hypothetical protein
MSWEMVSVGALNLDTFFFQAMAWLVCVQLDFLSNCAVDVFFDAHGHDYLNLGLKICVVGPRM